MNEIEKAAFSNLPIALSKPNELIGDWIKDDLELSVAQTFSDKKIRDYDEKDMEAMVDLFGKWHFLMGYSSPVTQVELSFICQFVYDNFKEYTMADLSLAMNWAISGKVDLTYVSQQKISALYVSKVLKVYVEKKAAIANEIFQNKQKALTLKESQKEVSSTDKANIFKEYLISCYEMYKLNGSFWDLPESIYKWMKKTKIVVPTQSDIDAAMQYGKDKLKAVKSKQATEHMIDKLKPEIKDPEEKIKRYAREYIVCQQFEKKDISELIKAIKIDYFI